MEKKESTNNYLNQSQKVLESNLDKPHKDEIRMVVPAGTIIIANLNLWHGGGNNITGKHRKMIMITIKRRDQLQLLNYKKYLSEKTKK